MTTGGDSQSVSSYRANTPANNSVISATMAASGGCGVGTAGISADEISLKSLPGERVPGGGSSGGASAAGLPAGAAATSAGHQQRSLSPVSNMSGDDLLASRRSATRRRPHLDKQLSENSSLLSAEDAVSERVRFDDNVSFIDEEASVSSANNVVMGSVAVVTSEPAKLHKVRFYFAFARGLMKNGAKDF